MSATLKERELRALATCAMCSQKVGHTGVPRLWRVTIEQYVLDLNAISRQTGLAMLLGGNGVLAAAMGTDEDMARRVGEATVFAVCERCAVESERSVAEMQEIAEAGR